MAKNDTSSFTTKQILNILQELYRNKEFKKEDVRFSEDDLGLLASLIYRKHRKPLLSYLSDKIISVLGTNYLSGPELRRIRFMFNLLNTFNGKKSAIMVGYAPASAANQACRIRKEMAGYKRKVIIGPDSRKRELWIKVR